MLSHPAPGQAALATSGVLETELLATSRLLQLEAQ